MRVSRVLVITLLLLASQIYALGAEVAVLRNGRSIPYVRKEQLGDTTRLYTTDGYVDILTEQIASFEVEEVPPTPPQETPAVQPATPDSSSTRTSQQTASKGKVDLDQLVREASEKRQLDPDFVNSVIKAESNFQPRAVSSKGAQGLMQLMPETAVLLGVSDPFDPRANVEAGTTYLSHLLDLYHDDPIKALAAYNAGPQRVQQYHGVPPYRDTHAYIARIVRDFNAKKMAKMKAGQAPTPATKTASNNASRKSSAPNRATAKKKVQQAKVAATQAQSGTN